MSVASHPLDFVLSTVGRTADVDALEIGIYIYTPQSIEDHREIVHVSLDDLDARCETLSRSLREGEEIALHSRVRLRGHSDYRHLPMIDFKGELRTPHRNRLMTLARDFRCHEIALFYTGRSYHFYGSELLTQSEWRRFLGRALLLNLPDEPEWVDTRWVGHGLIAGFSSLRWTRNSPHYRAIPRLAWHAEPEVSSVAQPAV